VNKFLGIGFIVFENNGCSSQGSGHFRSKIRTTVAFSDWPVVVNVLGTRPAVVIIGFRISIISISTPNL
jgi:hypothetical protein